MQLDANRVTERYRNEVSALTHRLMVAEALVEALQEQLAAREND